MTVVEKNMLIGEVVAKYPEAVDVMLKHGLHCIGCHVSPFESIEQGALGHGMTEEQLNAMMTEVNQFLAAAEHRKAVNPDAVVDLTPGAVEQVKKIMSSQGKEGYALRISAVPGGCAGFSYEMSFEKDARESDEAIQVDGVRVVLAKDDIQYLKGITIDYREALEGSGFTMRNPNAKSSCGCGHSFGV